MVYSKKESATGKTKYIKRYGNFYVLSTERSGAVDSVPDGWEVKEDSKGYLRLGRKK